MMLFLFVAISTRAANFRDGKQSLLHHADSLNKVVNNIRKGSLGEVQKSDITMHQGLGDNTPQHGCGYLGLGYDMIYGNPGGSEASLVDPGYRIPVIALTWSQESKYNSRDLQKLQPKQGWGIPVNSCQRGSTATTMANMQDYKNSLESHCSESASVEGEDGALGVSMKASASFSMSSGTNAFRNNVLKKKSEQFEVNSYCLLYKMGLNKPSSKLQLTDYFTKRLAALPLLNVANTGDCATNRCATMFLPNQKMYLGVESGQFKLTESAPKGKWLFGARHNVYWAENKGGKWKKNDNAVLTHSGGKLTMQARAEDKQEDQQWEFSRANQTLSLVTTAGKEKRVQYDNQTNALTVEEKDTNVMIVLGHASEKITAPWAQFFSDFGTHFLSEIELGGRLKTTVTMSAKSSKAISQLGMSTEAAVSLSYSEKAEVESFSASADVSAGLKTQSDALKKLKGTKKTEKTFVLGGLPPEELNGDAGFSQWANTVDDYPMPVNYKATPIAYLNPFTCDKAGGASSSAQKKRCKALRNTYVFFFNEYQDKALSEQKSRSALAMAAHLKAIKEAVINAPPPPIPDTLEQGSYHGGTHIQSKNKEFNVYMQNDGNLVLYNKWGDALWASGTSGCNNSPSLSINQDSNLVVYCGNGNQKWDSKTDKCKLKNNHQVKLTILNSGNLVLKRDSTLLWQTKTQNNQDRGSDGYLVCKHSWW